MSENHNQQLNQIRISRNHIALSQQGVTEGDRRIDKPDTSSLMMHTRRGLGWLFSPRSDESPKQSGVIESLEVDNFQLRQQLEEQRTSLLSCQEALDRAYRNMKELEQRLANLNQAHSEYIDKRDREFRNEIMRLRDQMSDVAAAGYSKQAIADSHKVSDNAILEIWKRMAYNIRVIATTLLTHCPPREELAVSYEGRPATVSNMAPAEYGLLADENLRAAVVENYIWRSVYARIFGGQRGKQSGAWCGLAGAEFLSLCSTLIRKLADADTIAIEVVANLSTGS
ncbi:hypothetical protein CSUB01_10600 [Colletotrichum sublineola]|uniref:Uncharacterized protein n=1 Tax=Colletotrichum sublineola TaxID=1173701 RepID=A0A066XA66_COLSU|nr:hypothetical protein CSUB01_10600 [Colletotrichum sublineola]